jgi:hypothetical protein
MGVYQGRIKDCRSVYSLVISGDLRMPGMKEVYFTARIELAVCSSDVLV